MAPTTNLAIAACAALVSSGSAFMLPAAQPRVSTTTMSAQKPSAKNAAAIFAAGAMLSGAVFTAPVDAAGSDTQQQNNVASIARDVKSNAGSAVQDAGSKLGVGSAVQDAGSKIADALPNLPNINLPNIDKDSVASTAKGAAGQAAGTAKDAAGSSQQGSRALDEAKKAGDALKQSVGSISNSGNAAGDAVDAAKDVAGKAKGAASNVGSSNILSANIGEDVKQGLKSATSAISSTADSASNSAAVPNTWSQGGSKTADDVVASAKGAADKAKGAASSFGNSGSNSNTGSDKGILPNGGGSPALKQAEVAKQAFSDTVGGATDGSTANKAGSVLSDAKGAAGQAKQAVKSSLGSNVISLNFGKPQQNKNADDLNPKNAPTILDGVKEAGQGVQRNVDKAQNIASNNADKVSNAGGDFGDALSQAGNTLKGKADQAGKAMESKDAFGQDKKGGKANFGSSNVVSLNFGKPQQNKNADDVNPKNAPTFADGLKTASKGAAQNADKAAEIIKNNANNVPNAGEDLSDAVARAGSSVKGEAKEGIKNLGTKNGW